MRVVHQQPGVVLLGDAHDLRKGCDVPFHAVEPVHHDQLPGLGRNRAQHALQIANVIVLEPLHVRRAEPRAVHDAGVRVLVHDHHVALVHERRDAAQVGQIAGRVDQSGFLAGELGQPLLQLHVHLEGAVEEAGAVVRGAETAKRVLGGGHDLGVLGQPQVVVRARHDDAAAVDGHLGAVVLRDRKEIGVDTCGLGQAVFFEAITLVE